MDKDTHFPYLVFYLEPGHLYFHSTFDDLANLITKLFVFIFYNSKPRSIFDLSTPQKKEQADKTDLNVFVVRA